jgi:hypothetical protein
MTEIQPQTTNNTPVVQNPPTVQSSGLLSNWKIKAGLIGTAVVSVMVVLFIVTFFWQHWVAGIGMKSWSSQAGAQPIECMIKDSNSDGYVSCSAMLKGEVVPLECGASIFNIGCRVNYGSAAAPVVRPSK